MPLASLPFSEDGCGAPGASLLTLLTTLTLRRQDVARQVLRHLLYLLNVPIALILHTVLTVRLRGQDVARQVLGYLLY